MALPDTLQASFSDGGFDLGEAVSAITDAYRAVAPPGVDIDTDALGSLAGRISGTDPAQAFSGVSDLAGAFSGVLGGLSSGSDLITPVTVAVQALTDLATHGTDLRSSLVSALTQTQQGERPVDRFAAGTRALTALPVGSVGEVVALLAPGALPRLPPFVTGIGESLAAVGGLPALATHLGLLLGGSTVVATAQSLAAVLGPLSDPAAVDAARTALLGLDGAALAARVASGDPEDDIVAAVTEGLAVLTAFTDAVNLVLIGGAQVLDVLDLASLETVFGQAVTAAAAADTAPVRNLSVALENQLSVVLDLRPTATAAGSVGAFADGLAAQVAPLTAAVRSADLAAVAAPLTSAVDTVLEPVRTVTRALRTAIETVVSTLDRIRAAIDDLGLDAVEHAVHTVIDPVVAVVNQVKGLLEPIASTLGTIATRTSTAIAQLRTTLGQLAGTIRDAFQALADAVEALHLEQLAGLQSSMDEVAASIEGIQIGTAVDEAVGFIHTAATVVGAIPFDLLPESARTEVTSAVAPIKQIDFGADVREPLSDAMSAALAEVEGPALDELTQAFGEVTRFLARIDPRPELTAIENEGLGELVTAVQAIDPDVILAPIKDALSGLGGLKDLLAPADHAFDQVLATLDELDPGPLLEPIAAEVDDVRTRLSSMLGIDSWVTEVTQACDRVLQATQLVHLTDVLDLGPTLLDELWPATGSPRQGLAGAQLVVRMLGPAANPVDILSFSLVGGWIAGHRTPADDLTAALDGARAAVVGLRTRVQGLDPATVLPTAGPAFDQVATAVAALPPGTLKDRLTPVVARPPAALLQPAIDARGQLLAQLAATTALIDRLRAVASGGLAGLAVNLRTALAPLTDALTGFATSWVARAGADPAGGLREALALVLTTVAQRLRPKVAALESAIRDKVTQAVEVAVRAPLTSAATSIQDLLATVDLRPLTQEVEAVFTAVRQPLAALKPSVALADLVTAIDGLLGDAAAWDPFRDVRGPLAQMKADVEAAALELRPTELLAPALQAYDSVTTALGAVDVGALFERTLSALHTLESDIEDGLTAAETAFGELQSALP